MTTPTNNARIRSIKAQSQSLRHIIEVAPHVLIDNLDDRIVQITRIIWGITDIRKIHILEVKRNELMYMQDDVYADNAGLGWW